MLWSNQTPLTPLFGRVLRVPESLDLGASAMRHPIRNAFVLRIFPQPHPVDILATFFDVGEGRDVQLQLVDSSASKRLEALHEC